MIRARRPPSRRARLRLLPRIDQALALIAARKPFPSLVIVPLFRCARLRADIAWSNRRGVCSHLAPVRGGATLPIIWRAKMEELMRSKLLKVALGCGFAAALVAPALACDFNKTSAQNDQPMAQSQQTTPDTPQTAESQPAADSGSN